MHRFCVFEIFVRRTKTEFVQLFHIPHESAHILITIYARRQFKLDYSSQWFVAKLERAAGRVSCHVRDPWSQPALFVFIREPQRMELQTHVAASGTVQLDGARRTREKCLVHVILLRPFTNGVVFRLTKKYDPIFAISRSQDLTLCPAESAESQNLDPQRHNDLTQMTNDFTWCHDENI